MFNVFTASAPVLLIARRNTLLAKLKALDPYQKTLLILSKPDYQPEEARAGGEKIDALSNAIVTNKETPHYTAAD